MHTQATIAAAREHNYQRAQIVAANRSRRMRGQQCAEVPAKITLTGFEVYVNGDYECFLPTDDEAEATTEAADAQDAGQIPAGIIKLKKAPVNGF